MLMLVLMVQQVELVVTAAQLICGALVQDMLNMNLPKVKTVQLLVVMLAVQLVHMIMIF